MRIKAGSDLVYMPGFRNALGRIKDRVFSPFELKNPKDSNTEHLAGVFAAKEAVIKALGLKPGCWLGIEIVNKKSGKPVVKLAKNLGKGKMLSCDLSISHDGKYAVAFFVALLK